MKKIYSFFSKQAVAAVLVSTLLGSYSASAQTCGGIVENFNSTGGTTAGFTGDFSLGNQNLVRNNVISTAVYTITSPTYQLPANATTLGFGFQLSGTEQVARAEVSVIFMNSLTNQMTTLLLSTIVPNYGSQSTATICRSVDLSEIPGLTAGSRYRIRIELTSNTGMGTLGQTITFDNFRTNGNPAQIGLPVAFIGIDAKRVSGGVLLTWKVAGEENVNRYEVERSADGRNFTAITNIGTAKKDAYTYLDAGNANGIVYYRVKNVDNDGKFKYSSIVRVVNGKSSIVIKAFPQPVVSQLTVQHPSVSAKGMITVSTADGRVVNSVRPAAGNIQTSVEMGKLQKGMYLVRFDDGEGNVETLKVIKQ